MPKIKQLRKSQNLNAMELAEKAGIDLNQPLMSAVESGKVLLTRADLWGICMALQCTPLDLFDNADEFDLMAVQRKMGALVWVEGKRVNKPTRFDDLPDANPKRSFRMSDEDYHALMVFIKKEGFNTISSYLRNVSKPTKVVIALYKQA